MGFACLPAAGKGIERSSGSTHAAWPRPSSLASGADGSEVAAAGHDELLAGGERVDAEDLAGVVVTGAPPSSFSARARTH